HYNAIESALLCAAARQTDFERHWCFPFRSDDLLRSFLFAPERIEAAAEAWELRAPAETGELRGQVEGAGRGSDRNARRSGRRSRQAGAAELLLHGFDLFRRWHRHASAK